jgi:hypothetical protein
MCGTLPKEASAMRATALIRIALVGMSVAGLLALGAGSAGPDGNAEPKCPKCGREMAPEWLYCPFDGTSLEQPASIGGLKPKGVLLEFYKAYARGDRATIAATVDLDAIIAAMVASGLDRVKDLSPEMRGVLRKYLAKEAPRVLKPLVLDVITSREMRREYTPPEDLSPKLVDLMYKTEMVGEADTEAHLVPTKGVTGADPLGQVIILKKVEGRWLIHRLPSLK